MISIICQNAEPESGFPQGGYKLQSAGQRFFLPESKVPSISSRIPSNFRHAPENHQSLNDLNRHRAGLTDNKAATIDNIIDERHKEFVGEGKRYWDLIRTGKAATTLVPDAYGYRTNTWTEKKKYLPIPLSEIDASHGTLTQNDY